jgi:prephenate dehydratase
MRRKKVLVADAFTNGDDVTPVLLRGQDWDPKDFEIVYCNGNPNVVGMLRASRGALGVLPVYNSRLGREIPEVTLRLQELEREGYSFRQLAKVDHPVSHCLMVPKFIHELVDVTKVMSHPEALAQCDGFLEHLGICKKDRFACPSTGAAAAEIARFHGNEEGYDGLAVIAPMSAAQHLDLRVLVEIVHNDPRVFTRFLLLEHA